MKTPKWPLLSEIQKSQQFSMWRIRGLKCESSVVGRDGGVRVGGGEIESRRPQEEETICED